MGLFDGLAAAFENDSELGEVQDAGLKKRIQYQTITWQGPPPEGMAAMFEKPEVSEQQAIPGQPLKDLAFQQGIPLKYSCNQGTCGICDVKVNGVETPACTAKMPKADVKIEYRATAAAQERMKAKMKEQAAARKAAKAGKAAPAAAPAAGSVKPTGNPFGGFAPPGNPFEGASNPFSLGAPKAAEPTGPSVSELEAQLKAENDAKKAKANPFGGFTPPSNPFEGASNPFSLKPPEPTGPSASELEAQLKAEEEAKKAKKGGWPFG